LSVISNKTRRVLFITQWRYNDALIQTYTLPYIRIIRNITPGYFYLIAVSDRSEKIKISKRGNIALIELPLRRKPLLLQWLLNIIALVRISTKKNIPIVHTFCTPAGAIGALLKMMNKKRVLVLDSVEPHAESMVESKTWSTSGIKFKLLWYMEKKQFKMADRFIMAAEGMDKYILNKYGVTVKDFSTKPACVDLNEFSFGKIQNPDLMAKYNLADKVTCVYAGKFGGFYMEDEVFVFMKKCEDFWGSGKFRFLILSNIDDEYVKQKVKKTGLSKEAVLRLFVPHKDVPEYMGLADFAICPFKPIPSKRYATPIKNGEYWALGLPVVITPNISNDSEVIEKHNAGAIVETLDDKGYMKAIEKIDSIISGKSRAEIYAQIRPLAEKYRNFTIAEKVYGEVYASLG